MMQKVHVMQVREILLKIVTDDEDSVGGLEIMSVISDHIFKDLGLQNYIMAPVYDSVREATNDEIEILDYEIDEEVE